MLFLSNWLVKLKCDHQFYQCMLFGAISQLHPVYFDGLWHLLPYHHLFQVCCWQQWDLPAFYLISCKVWERLRGWVAEKRIIICERQKHPLFISLNRYPKPQCNGTFEGIFATQLIESWRKGSGMSNFVHWAIQYEQNPDRIMITFGTETNVVIIAEIDVFMMMTQGQVITATSKVFPFKRCQKVRKWQYNGAQVEPPATYTAVPVEGTK